MKDENRETRLRFYVTADEKAQIKARMASFGIDNMSAYLRKMALNGYLLKLQLDEIKECVHLLRSISNNVNQMAKRANASGTVDSRELGRVREVLEQSWQAMNDLLNRLGNMI